MDHVVFFPAPGGAPAFRRTSSLEDAVRLVEHLRNVEGVEGATVHALVDVPLSFKAYYRVEVPTVEGFAPAEPAAVPSLETVVPALTLVEDLQDAPVAVAAEPLAVEETAQEAPVEVPALAVEVPVQGEAPQEYATPRAANSSLGFFA